MTDRSLLQKFVESGEQACFAELVTRHGGMILAAARRLAGDDADDVAQAVFLLLAQKASTLVSHQNLAGWLFETTRNCAANARRQRRRWADRNQSSIENAMSESVPPSADYSELLEKLDDGLSRLSSSYKQVLLMRYIENRSVEETATQLGLSSSAVMKRSTRGLAKLRQFLARHGITSSTGSLSACMVSQAMLLSSKQRLMLLTPSGSAHGLAAATRWPITFTTAKLAATVVAVAVVGIVSVELIRSLRLMTVGATVPPAVASRSISAVIPPTVPPLLPPTAGAPRDAADQFLKALANADVDEVARYVPPGDDAKSISVATAYVENFRDKLYAGFPQRLTVQNSSVEMANDGKQTPLGGTFDVQTPIEADLGHLTMTVAPVKGHWYVTASYTDADAMFAAAARTDLTAGAADSFDYSKAAALIAAFNSVAPHTDPAQLKDAEIPKLTEGMDAARKAMNELPGALRGSALQFLPEDAKALDDALIRAEDRMRQHGAATIQPETARMQQDPKVMQSAIRLMAVGAAIQQKVDRQSEAVHGTPRPVAIDPERHLTGKKQTITIPGPLKFPEWLRTTASYKDWQTKHDVRTFTTRDDAGNIYIVAAWGWVKDAVGATHEVTSQIRMYRRDKTLAEVTDWSPAGGEPMDWTAMDSTGKALAWKMTQHERNNGKVSIDLALHFEPDGSERRYQIDQEGTIDRATTADPIGEHEVSSTQ